MHKRQSYLLRLWPVQAGGQLAWRATLVRIPDGAELTFASIEDLFEHLRKLAAQPAQNSLLHLEED